MSRTKLLLNLVTDLNNLSESVQAIAEVLASNEEERQDKPKPKPAKKEKKISLEDVRTVLAEKSQAGFTNDVRGLLEKHGAAKLSEVDPKKYAQLLKDAEELQ